MSFSVCVQRQPAGQLVEKKDTNVTASTFHQKLSINPCSLTVSPLSVHAALTLNANSRSEL